jgi:hypothetical protein
MSFRDEYHDETYLIEAKDYAPSTASDNLKAHPSRPSCEEQGIQLSSCEDGLPPVDAGIQAWLFLIASTVLEALVWGEHFRRSLFYGTLLTCPGWADAFGIFQDYYSVHGQFKGSENIAVIGTCAMVQLPAYQDVAPD